MIKELICVICPIGCNILVEGHSGESLKIEGNGCERGHRYAVDEFISPTRILTTSIKIKNAKQKMLPVRSKRPIPKDIIFDCMKALKDVSISAPIKIGQPIMKNVGNLEVDIVASTTIIKE